jgi:hypothetical protein
MTTEVSRTEILPEADAIHAIHVALRDAAERLNADAYTLTGSYAVHMGRLVQSLSDASDGVFDALNTAASYCGSAAADAAIKRGWAERDAANAAASDEAASECEGHPAGPSDPMGETVYCDGTCQQGTA